MNLNTLKEIVCEENLNLVKYGLVTLTWGNVGQLTDDADAFVIKPSGVSYDTMKPCDMVVVDLNGNVIEGSNRPSSDTPTYVELYKYFVQYSKTNSVPLLRGIVHTHSSCAVSWAQARREIPCFGTTHADHFYGPVPLTRPLTEAEINAGYEVNTGRVIVERFTQADLNPIEIPAVLAAGHGPFAWGSDAHNAVKNAVALEAVAVMARDSLSINPNTPDLEPWVLQKHYTRKHGPNAYYGQKSTEKK